MYATRRIPALLGALIAGLFGRCHWRQGRADRHLWRPVLVGRSSRPVSSTSPWHEPRTFHALPGFVRQSRRSTGPAFRHADSRDDRGRHRCSAVVHLLFDRLHAATILDAAFLRLSSLFTFFMLMLVTADNSGQLFFGWEGVGLCSYLLIGFWYDKPSANAAAIKAFVVNRVGDFGFALGIFGDILVVRYSLDSIDLSAPHQMRDRRWTSFG